MKTKCSISCFSDECYDMNSEYMGNVLIFNNDTFWRNGSQKKETHGTSLDMIRLNEVFMKLGFKIQKKDNLTAKVKVFYH